MSSCWACCFHCLPSCLQWKCCEPQDPTVVTHPEAEEKEASSDNERIAKIVASRTPPATPNHVPSKRKEAPSITVHRPASPPSDQAGRVAVIHDRANHNRLASTEVVSMNRILHEKRDSVVT